MCILTGRLKPKGGQMRREVGLMETLFPAGGRSCGICCATLSYQASLCFASGIPTQCYIICSQPFTNTNTLFCVTLGQSWVKCNWNWMIPCLPELARHKSKLKNKEASKRTQIPLLCLVYLYNFSCGLCFHVCVSLVLLEAPGVATSSH